MVVTPKAITFANVADSSMLPYSCEYNYVGDASEIVQATVEQRVNNEVRIFATTTDSLLLVFQAKIA